MSQTPCCCSLRPDSNAVSPEAGRLSERYRLGLKTALLLLSAAGILWSLCGRERLPFPGGVDPVWLTILLCGVPLIWEGVLSLCRRRITTEVLVATAVIATIAIGQSFAAGEVAFIMALGEALERWTVRRARAGIEKLIRLTPQKARRLDSMATAMVTGTTIVALPEVKTSFALGDNVAASPVPHEDVALPETHVEVIVDISEIKSGDLLRVLPGETVPVDGAIVVGNTSIDQQLISGEPIPVDKSPGDDVFCGTINRFGAFTMRATRVGADSSLARMVRLVREAEVQKAPMERIADRWASILVPIALLTALIVGLVSGEIIRGVTILVVFCPCALVLATPTAIIAAIGNASRYGILVRSGEALERLGKVDLLAFDKTGTLTQGRPMLRHIEVLHRETPDDGKTLLAGMELNERALLILAASLERFSEHPLSQCIVQAAEEREFSLIDCSGSETVPGRGIRGNVAAVPLLIGNRMFLSENGIEPDAVVEKRATSFLENGETLVWVATGGQILGFLTITDTIRPDAADTVRLVRQEQADIVLLTGDHAGAALSLGKTIGIEAERIHVELRPEDKLRLVENWQREGHRVAMIGDGLNDAPALKVASVGIAMGTAGSDLAIDAADVTLVGDDISRIPFLVRLSRKTAKTILANIGFAMGINFAAIILASGGWIDPVIGALVHNLGSVVVILNASLLLHVKR